jgi:hypothetical protein
LFENKEESRFNFLQIKGKLLFKQMRLHTSFSFVRGLGTKKKNLIENAAGKKFQAEIFPIVEQGWTHLDLGKMVSGQRELCSGDGFLLRSGEKKERNKQFSSTKVSNKKVS